MQQERITILDVYAPNTRATKFVKGIVALLKSHIDPNTVMLGDFNILITQIRCSSRHNLTYGSNGVDRHLCNTTTKH